eukprot:1804084-Amphidinium_carterae.1
MMRSFEAFCSHGRPAGSYPAPAVQSILERFHNSRLSHVFHYDMTFFWATLEMTQFSDLDMWES